jgi:putative inorganic carbon (hco3(-)) transporter
MTEVGSFAEALNRRPVIVPGVLLLLLLTLAIMAAGSPLPVVVGLGAAAVLVLSAIRVDIALLALIGTAPLETAFQISSNPQLTLTKLVGLLALAGFVIHLFATRRLLRLSWPHGVVVALFLLALVSTLQARDESLALATTLRYGSFAALYFVVSQLADNDRLLRRIIWVLSGAATVAGVLALQLYLSGDSYAAVTLYGDPNDDAFSWITTLPLALWLFSVVGPKARALVVVMVGTMATATMYSFSRGALVGLAAGIVWEIVVERRHLRLLAGAAVAAILASVVVLSANPGQLQTSLRGKAKVAAHNVEGRLDAWTVAAELAVQHPALGIGPGNFALAYPEEAGRPPGSKSLGVVHNAYLDVAAELGVGGLLLFVAFLAGSFAQLSAVRRVDAYHSGLAAAARTSLVMACVAALTLSEQYFQPFWLLGGIGAALWVRVQAKNRQAEGAEVG